MDSETIGNFVFTVTKLYRYYLLSFVYFSFYQFYFLHKTNIEYKMSSEPNIWQKKKFYE